MTVTATASGAIGSASKQVVYTSPGINGGTLVGVIESGSSSPYTLNHSNQAWTSQTMFVYGDDTVQINTAITNAGAVASSGSPQVVLLNAGCYNISNTGVLLQKNYVTLRGSGLPAAMATGGNATNDNLSQLNYVSGTWLQLVDRITNRSTPNITMGSQFINWQYLNPSTASLTADTVQGGFTCSVSSASGLSVGQYVVIDHITDTDPNFAQNNQANLSGFFVGDVSGTSLTFTSAISSNQGVILRLSSGHSAGRH